MIAILKERRSAFLVLIGVGLSSISLSPATSQSLPVPNLAIPVEQLADERKYFILHKPNVSIEEATADFSFCWRFLSVGALQPVPRFIPWGQTPPTKPSDYANNQFGLVGSIMLSIVAGPVQRGIRQSRLIRCMTPRGYLRYRTSEAIWRQLNSDDAKQSISLQAQIAAGPVPPTPEVDQ